jgi:hypothetical protein
MIRIMCRCVFGAGLALLLVSNVVSAQGTPRITTIKTADKTVDIRTLPGSEVLKGKSGKTITVERLRQLQAKIDSQRPAPVVIAQPGQKISALASSAPGTRVVLPGARTVRSEDMAKVQSVMAKLSQKRTPMPVPSAQSGSATSVVGQGGFSMADALKRPGNELIQVGQLKYTADQLRQIDTAIKGSKRDARGLSERTPARAQPVAPTPSGPRVPVKRETTIKEMLAKPDNAVLQTPSGKTVTVAQLKQYMAQNNLTADQLEAKFRGRK